MLYSFTSCRFGLRQTELVYTVSLNMLQRPIQLNIPGNLVVNYNLLSKVKFDSFSYARVTPIQKI